MKKNGESREGAQPRQLQYRTTILVVVRKKEITVAVGGQAQCLKYTKYTATTLKTVASFNVTADWYAL